MDQIQISLLFTFVAIVSSQQSIYDTSWFQNFVPGEAVKSNLLERHTPVAFNNPQWDVLHEFINACHQSKTCSRLKPQSHEMLDCIRKCVSPKCFLDVYRHDQGEDGEIDFKFDEFAKCFFQKWNHSRSKK